MKLAIVVVIALYGALVLVNTLVGAKVGLIRKENAIWTSLWTAFVFVFGCFYQMTDSLAAFSGVAVGLFGYSSVALRNAFAMGQRPKLNHHLIRLGIHAVLLALLYFL